MAADTQYHPKGLPDPDALVLDLYSGWADVKRKGDGASPHVHQSSLSGVYYVDTGYSESDRISETSRPPSSSISFSDPRTVAEYGQMYRYYSFGGKIKMSTHAGTFLLFPAWLSHYVEPHKGDTARVAIAFNVAIPSLGHV